MSVATKPKALYEARIFHADSTVGSHDDLDGGPCSEVSAGDGAWNITVLDGDKRLERLAIISITSQSDEDCVSADLVFTPLEIGIMEAIRDSLNKAIAAMKKY